jgi:NAD(P)-dependent dehydrogenase (short-subunit alcohol dehydrogenase family)
MEPEAFGVVVSGGASGLGAAVAARFVAAGAHVVVLDLRPGEHGEFVEGDVTDPTAVGAAVAAAASAPAGLRLAVSCAGIGPPERVLGREGPHDLERFTRVVTVNLIGTFNLLRLAAEQMAGNAEGVDGERGVIVNTASIAAFEPQIGQAAYAASKGGVVSMALAAAQELSQRGIRVVTIAPGIFDTPLLATLSEEVRHALAQSQPFPKRLGDPSEFASLVAHIYENRLLNGATLRLDSGLRMPPR